MMNGEKHQDDWKTIKRKLYWECVFPYLVPAISISLGCFITLIFRLILA